MWQANVLASLYRLPRENAVAPPPHAPKLPSLEPTPYLETPPDTSVGFERVDPEPETTPEVPPMTLTSSTTSATVKRTPNKKVSLLKSLPDAEMVLETLRGGNGSGFNESMLARMRATFMRFRDPDTKDINKDELAGILEFLGYSHIHPKEVIRMADEINAYATLEVDEFVKFMEMYSEFENERYREVFNRFDANQKGYLDTDDVMRFLSHLGHTPLRSAVNEAIKLVDLDNSGKLEFEEVVLLTHLYRHSEGFTRAEVQRFSECFEDMDRIVQPGSEDELVPAEQLTILLTSFFGVAKWDTAKKLSDELMATAASKQKPSGGATAGQTTVPLGMQFSEALVWARRVRDKEFADYREAFAQYDTDGSGLIDRAEVRAVLKQLGYTVTDRALLELLKKAHSTGACHDMKSFEDLDYDNFVHFMQVMSETDGFMEDELAEIEATFKKFDEDDSGDIDAVELGDVLNHMGYKTSLDEVQTLLARVDYDGSGELSLREFMRFLRLHRETALASMRNVFNMFAGASGVVDDEGAKSALMQLREHDNISSLRNGPPPSAQGSRPPPGSRRGSTSGMSDADHDQEIMALEIPEPLDFDAFFELAEKLRETRVKESRKRAGFTDDEIGRFKDLFDHHDSEKGGTLEANEVTQLLFSLGFTLRTVKEKQEIASMLQEAKAKAFETGAVEEVGPINFWVVVQLLRRLYKRDDRMTMDKVSRAAQESRFSPAECAEFQEVFMGWYESDQRFSEHNPVEQAAPRGGGRRHSVTDEECKTLTNQSLVRLLRSLGMKIESHHRTTLDAKVAEITESGNAEGVEFSDFLRLMRWMMDTNFANMCSVVPHAGAGAGN